MTIREAIQNLSQQLIHIYDEQEAKAIAKLVVEHITGKNRNELSIIRDEFSEEQQQLLNQYAQRLNAHEPVQYVLKEAWFFGMKFYVDKNVLIPRPETEELVKWVLDDWSHKPSLTDRNYKIMDCGTGSGCIAVALRKNLPMHFETWACDINDQVLTVARKNADDHHALVDFVPMDFLDDGQRNQLPHIDLIVSNPPYVPLRDKDTMHDNVVQFEPHTALFVPDDNVLVFYEAIARYGREKLYPGGTIYVEIHESLGKKVADVFAANHFSNIELKKDMQGKDRMIRCAISR